MGITESSPGIWTGDSEELAKMKDVRTVMARLLKLGIDLSHCEITIIKVYSQQSYAQPYGFDFKTPRMKDILSTVSLMSHRRLAMSADDFDSKAPAVFNEDDKHNVEGFISSYVTEGRGFREISSFSGLHLELDAANDRGNIHIDSHVYVAGEGQYDWSRSGGHGYWDLVSSYVPGLFGKIGENGRVGPMVRPIKTPDGSTRWIFGFISEF